MRKSEIATVFLSAILFTGALTAAIPSFIEDTEAQSDNRDKKDYERDYDIYEKRGDIYYKDESYGYDPQYKKKDNNGYGYDQENKMKISKYDYDNYDKEHKVYVPKSYENNKYPVKERVHSYDVDYSKDGQISKKSINNDNLSEPLLGGIAKKQQTNDNISESQQGKSQKQQTNDNVDVQGLILPLPFN